MTASNNNELRTAPTSRRTSVADQGAVSDSSAGASSSRRALPPRPAGPRSPERAGSIHTSYTVVPAAQLPSPGAPVATLPELAPVTPFPPPAPTSLPTPAAIPQPPSLSPTEGVLNTDVTITVAPIDSSPLVPLDHSELPAYEYRSPEAVIESLDEPSASNLPPGVLAEHDDDDDVDFDHREWAAPANNEGNARLSAMDVDLDSPALTAAIPERPQIGPGVLARRWLEAVHEHHLYQPIITELPKPPLPKPPSRQPTITEETAGSPPSAGVSPTEPPVPTIPPLTVEDVLASLPGGLEHHHEWYFCPECWGWLHVKMGNGDIPDVLDTDEWEKRVEFGSSFDREQGRIARQKQLSRLKDIATSRSVPVKNQHHFHSFPYLVLPTTERHIDRVQPEGYKDAFSHLDLSYGVPPPELVEFKDTANNAALHVSCSSDAWVFVDYGPVPGQVPIGLVKEFTAEKKENPNVGVDRNQSVVDAWSLIITLLQNPLFRGNRGWVKLENKTFSSKIGASLRSSHLLERVGFGCRLEDEGYRVGPFAQGGLITDEHVTQMNAYMARTWVEVTLWLQQYQRQNGLGLSSEWVRSKTLGEDLDRLLDLSKIPHKSIPYSGDLYQALNKLGASIHDVPSTIEDAYDLQVSDDAENTPQYLGALERISKSQLFGSDTLQIRVATERSMDRYTDDEVDEAYSLIGCTPEHVSTIMVEREEMPVEHLLDLHRSAMSSASDSKRAEISRALFIIGKDRRNDMMVELGKSGGSYLSLDQAYREFNLSRDTPIDDEMLIMTYDGWISDRPSRADHYRMALSIIANAPGEERPVLQAYLAGKDISEFQGPVRRDLPAGLRNIGNTCYLNSVLQFLYTVKPVRDAVTNFEESLINMAGDEEDSAKNKEKLLKVQSSQRFVRHLKDLFNEMYNTDSSAVVPQEELARLAILPIDLVGERAPASAPKGRVTIDSLPTILSPISSNAATVAGDSAPPTPRSIEYSPPSSPPPGARPILETPERRTSVLGKRASQDRESQFGGSEERLRRLTDDRSDEIELDSPTEAALSPTETNEDVEMIPVSRSSTTDLGIPSGFSKLELTSPMTEEPPTPLAVVSAATGIATPADSPPPVQAPLPAAAAAAPPPQRSAPPPLPPRRPSMALVAAEKFGLQQDAAEILINVLAQLEYAFDRQSDSEGHELPNLIQGLFSSKFQQQMLLESTDGSPAQSNEPVESVFVHPIIGVEEDGKDLYDCLSELYLGGAEIEYEGKKGFKMDLIDELPPLLYIQMRRSQYDPIKRAQTKTNTHVPFGRKLVMDRFLASADPAKRQRSITLTREMMQMRARRHELKNHKPMAIAETFRFVRDALSTDAAKAVLGASDDSAVTPDLLEALGLEASAADEEIASIEAKLPQFKEELERLWANDNTTEYELVSVFVHGGTGTGGHYWTYQADLPRDGDKYFYYSDEVVKDVPASDVFSDKSAQGVSPALLCYVRKDRHLVDTLHRAAAPEEGSEELVAVTAATTESGPTGGW
ncbi:ubiquitin-specific protease ubp2 [Vanrija albida]|uniref:ubiquitinyl hydrolase 1 n=1 Tax=Vanrija albida TaxID=181172 RepID=A0ABR3QFX3_9TREE